jgi:hypothetical protein
LPDELVQPLLGRRPVAFVVDIGPVRRTGRLPVDRCAVQRVFANVLS